MLSVLYTFPGVVKFQIQTAATNTACVFAFSSSLDRCTYVVSGAHLQTDVRDDDDDDDDDDDGYNDNDKQHQQLIDTSPTTVFSPFIRRRRRKPCVVSGHAHTIRN